MAVIKCKMCGGDLPLTEGMTVCECEYCGTRQTIPRFDTEKKLNLYGRANHFRRNNEFDKAEGIYEKILDEDPTDAESYWSLVLCRYGIEYVEDPATHKRVPTVNRAQYTSIYADENYKKALEYSDTLQKSIYEAEAKAIDDIQKGILEISAREEPFDVFICYKETDEQGRRTRDSVDATELYHALTNEGFKVFFSRITLEDKLGTAYEPYIFAALNSSKVMVVLGSKLENFNAVWVKNEWSRYLALIQAGEKKTLIPAYRDMDPYDLPEEFSHLQSQDMSKLGFLQDLVRGIRKIIGEEETKTAAKETVVVSGGADVAPLLKRAFIFLEDGNFSGADEYCERVLDKDPENARAYLGKLMAEKQVQHQENLADCAQPFESSDNYQKALRYGDDSLVSSLKGYINHINDRNEVVRKDAIYAASVAKMTGEKAEPYEMAMEGFRSIPKWKGADTLINICQKKIEEIRANEEVTRQRAKQSSKKRKKILSIVIPSICACIILVLLITTVVIPNQKQNQAMERIGVSKGDVVSVGDIITLGSYKDFDNISWIVLAREGNKLLVISEYAMDLQPYNNAEETDVRWADSDIRSWLNKSFLNEAFSPDEQQIICETEVDNSQAQQYSGYDTSGGIDTSDKVFLLSYTEATTYFKTSSDRRCQAVENGSNCDWWLRSPGAYQDTAASIDSSGAPNWLYTDYDLYIRPAMWIDLDS